MNGAKIVGIGHYCPDNIVDNDRIATIVDTSNEWIVKRTGIERRRISTGEGTVDMGAKAALNAIDKAGCTPGDIDLIVVATTSPDNFIPSTACRIQDVLGCKNATAFDVGAACSGFLYALIVANSLVKSGERTRALVIGAEVLSRIVNWDDRNTCVLFGDGAGAAVIEISNDSKGIMSTCFGSDGELGKVLTTGKFPIITPFYSEESTEKNYISMEGKAVFKFAVSIIPKIVTEVLNKANVDISEIKYIVPHQANSRIIEESAKRLNLTMDKFYMNLNNYGNTSAASVPIALSEMVEKGMLEKGDKIILAGFGGGLTWAGTLIEW